MLNKINDRVTEASKKLKIVAGMCWPHPRGKGGIWFIHQKTPSIRNNWIHWFVSPSSDVNKVCQLLYACMHAFISSHLMISIFVFSFILFLGHKDLISVKYRSLYDKPITMYHMHVYEKSKRLVDDHQSVITWPIKINWNFKSPWLRLEFNTNMGKNSNLPPSLLIIGMGPFMNRGKHVCSPRNVDRYVFQSASWGTTCPICVSDPGGNWIEDP